MAQRAVKTWIRHHVKSVFVLTMVLAITLSVAATNFYWEGQEVGYAKFPLKRCWQVVYLEDETFDWALPVWNFTGSAWLPAEKSDCDILEEHCGAHNKTYSLCEWDAGNSMCVCRFRNPYAGT